MFVLFSTILTCALTLLDYILGSGISGKSFDGGILYLLYAFAVLVPLIKVVVRRLHDTGKSGCMYLIIFISIMGWIWFFVLMVMDGNSGENKYGKNPKEVNS